MTYQVHITGSQFQIDLLVDCSLTVDMVVLADERCHFRTQRIGTALSGMNGSDDVKK